jgi:hypothetical protein
MNACAEKIAEAVYEACRPWMREEAFCINAAAVTRLVLPAYDVQSWPVQVTALHANEAYYRYVEEGGDEALLPAYWDAEPGDPYCVWARAEPTWKARTSADQLDADRRRGRPGLPGHVVTWVPAWSCYLDPTAGQFSRPERGIELGPTVWDAEAPPPVPSQWLRRDGGVSVIYPTDLKGYAHSGAWRHRNDSTTRQLAADAEEMLRL